MVEENYHILKYHYCRYPHGYNSPASAVLIIPRQEGWDAIWTFFYLNDYVLDIWRSRLIYGPLGDLPICQNKDATEHFVFPSGGFSPLLEHHNEVYIPPALPSTSSSRGQI